MYAFFLLGLLVFLFSFWRKLYRDYEADRIFSSAFIISLSLAIGYVISKLFLPSWWFWICFATSFVGVIIAVKKSKLVVFETLDAYVYSCLRVLAICFLYFLLKDGAMDLLAGLAVVIFFILIFALLDKHYRKFSWYKSGRVGFTGLSVSGLFFLTRSVVALYLPNMLSFVGRQEVILSAVLAFLSFLVLFDLSRGLSKLF